jgi:hypothetical protein
MLKKGVVLSVLVLGLGCSSRSVLMAPALPQPHQDLGPATARACGVQLGMIPIASNARFSRAYRRAVASVPGAIGLRDVTIRDEWTFIVIGLRWCASVEGTAFQ